MTSLTPHISCEAEPAGKKPSREVHLTACMKGSHGVPLEYRHLSESLLQPWPSIFSNQPMGIIPSAGTDQVLW